MVTEDETGQSNFLLPHISSSKIGSEMSYCNEPSTIKEI